MLAAVEDGVVLTLQKLIIHLALASSYHRYYLDPRECIVLDPRVREGQCGSHRRLLLAVISH